jgi:hypothetical protein
MPLIYQPVERRFVGFGGSHEPIDGIASTTWVFSMDDLSWTPALALFQTPLPRFGHCAVYLPTQNEMLMLGGSDHDGFLLPPEAWTYNIATREWTQLQGVLPEITGGCTATWLPNGSAGDVIIFGGTNVDGHALAETWRYDPVAHKFTLPMMTMAPPARFGAIATYDAAGGRVLVYGGNGGDTTTPLFRDDLWAFDGAQWREIKTAGGPPARSYAAAGFDLQSRVWLVWGGTGDGGDFDDLWIWTTATNVWTPYATPALRPSPRSQTSFGYDQSTRTLLVFCGLDSKSGMPLDEGWRLTWTKL